MQRAPEIVGVLLIERVVEMVFGVEDRLDLGLDGRFELLSQGDPGVTWAMKKTIV
jgi:hypothetical protein